MRKFPIDIKIGQTVESLIRVHEGFEVGDVDGAKYLGRTVLICSGKRPRMLERAGEEKLRGRGVTYCEVCDGPLFQDMDVAVIGGGNSALEAAIDMTKIARHIYLVSLTPLTGDHILREKSGGAQRHRHDGARDAGGDWGTAMVSGIRVKDLKSGQEKVLTVGGVFVEIGLIPNSDFVRDMLTLNELGEIMVNCACETGVPGSTRRAT